MAGFVVARCVSNRPTTQHRVDHKGDRFTVCGWDMSGWTRYWMTQELPVIVCLRCKAIEAARAHSKTRR